MDLFDYMRSNTMEKEAPLASRLRPRTLEEVVGQQEIIGKGKLLYRAIKADKLGSIIFYGPPGTGKTTLAKVIAKSPQIIFADEPTGSLDERNRDYVLEILQELNYQGKTIVVVTHDPHVNECAQRHIMLKANHTLHDLKNRECTMLNSIS